MPLKKLQSLDEVTPGLWYLKTDYGRGYTVVSVLFGVIPGPWEGEKMVFRIDEEGPIEIYAFSPEQFICEVPKPD